MSQIDPYDPNRAQAVPSAPPAPPAAPAPPAPQQQQQVWAPAPVAGNALVSDQRVVSGGVLAFAWICAVLTAGYLLPWAIAATRGRSNQATIGLLNLLLGWSLIGWVVALVMACQSHSVLVVANYAPVVNVYTAPAAGWYPAPSGYGQEYWNGAAWTGHRAP